MGEENEKKVADEHRKERFWNSTTNSYERKRHFGIKTACMAETRSSISFGTDFYGEWIGSKEK